MKVCVHLLGEVDIELAGTEEAELFPICQYPDPEPDRKLFRCKAYQCERVETLGVALRLEHQTQLRDLSLLFRRQVTSMSAQGDGGGGREVVVIVLGVELQGAGDRRGGSHFVAFMSLASVSSGRALGCRGRLSILRLSFLRKKMLG